MTCSACIFFGELGVCRSPKTRRHEVGYFQKACPDIELPEPPARTVTAPRSRRKPATR